MHIILTRWCGWRTIKILSCLTLLTRFEKVLILFRYVSHFGKSCPHWFGLQKLAHKCFFSSVVWAPLEHIGAQSMCCKRFMFDVQETQLSKMVNFANILKMVTFSNRMSLFLVTAKQLTFCCFLLEQGSKIWPHWFHAKRRHNVSSQIARLPTPPRTIKCRLSGGQMTLDARTSRRSVVVYMKI